MSDLMKVKQHLNNGGVIQVTTYLKSWLYDAKHIDLFGEDSQGFLTIKQGKKSVSLKYCSIRFYNRA